MPFSTSKDFCAKRVVTAKMTYVVECEADITLVKSLIFISRKNIIHGGNKPGVLETLERRQNCKGMVDEDPWSIQPPKIYRFQEKEYFPGSMLRILRNTNRNNYLIILCPRLEDWILEAAKESNVDVETYNLP